MNLVVSQANKALVAPPIPGVLNLFGTAPRLPDGRVVIPHGIRETMLMKHLGFTVPNPCGLYYDYNGGTPFDVQRKSFLMLTSCPRCYLLNEMGTGKTKIVIWAFDALKKMGVVKKMVVIAPLSTLNFVWAREIFDTAPHLRIQVLHGTKEQRLERLAKDADVYIINHDGVPTIYDALRVRSDIDVLCLDELAVYRNNSDRSKLMRKFAQKFTYVWGLTGTPMPNAPTDVWAQAKIITPNTVPKYQNEARNMLMYQVSQYVWKPKQNSTQLAFNMLQPSCRYTLKDVVELPDLIERPLKVEMTDQQIWAYNTILKDLVVQIQGKQITALNAGAAMSKLVQAAGGWIFTKHPQFVRIDASKRIVALIDLIQSAERKVIVYVPFTPMIEGISKILNQKGIGIKHYMVHGPTPDGERDKIFTEFQCVENSHRVLLANPGCIKHGLTLTAADTIIWYLPTPSLDVYDQANARIIRVGQKHEQQIINMEGTPVERHLYGLLRTKEKNQDKLLDLLEQATEEPI